MAAITTTRARLALAIALVADAIELGAFPIFALGVASPWNDVLDVSVAIAMVVLLGWHWAFAPSFVAEMIPFVSLVPTWTAAVLIVGRGHLGPGAPEVSVVPPTMPRRPALPPGPARPPACPAPSCCSPRRRTAEAHALEAAWAGRPRHLVLALRPSGSVSAAGPERVTELLGLLYLRRRPAGRPPAAGTTRAARGRRWCCCTTGSCPARPGAWCCRRGHGLRRATTASVRYYVGAPTLALAARAARARGDYSNVDDLRRLLEHLDLAPAVLLGCSAGGGLALDFALAEPERVAALVLVGPVVSGFGLSEHFRERTLHNLSPTYFGRSQKEAVERWVSDRYLTDPPQRRRARRAWPSCWRATRSRPAVGDTGGRPAAPPAVGRLDQVGVPVLLVTGESDVPEVQAHIGVLAAGLAQAERQVIAVAGHLPQLERPEELAARVLDFLAPPTHVRALLDDLRAEPGLTRPRWPTPRGPASRSSRPRGRSASGPWSTSSPTPARAAGGYRPGWSCRPRWRR